MSGVRKTKRRKQDRMGNRMALVGITFVVLSLAVVVNIRGTSLEQKNQEYRVREENLLRQKEAEEERAAQLEEKRIFVQTKQYIEQIAKEKLGLVNPDEILLKPEN